MSRHPKILTILWQVSRWASRTTNAPRVLHPIEPKDTNSVKTPPPVSLQLRTLLRRTPTWTFGHLALAEEALRDNDIATAYASAQAAMILLTSEKHLGDANRDAKSSPSLPLDLAHTHFILGRCYLRRSVTHLAFDHLHLAKRHPHFELKAKEELAATYMTTGEYEQAIALLREIPPEALSAESSAAVAFLSKKLVGS